jgi:hypothetical protein
VGVGADGGVGLGGDVVVQAGRGKSSKSKKGGGGQGGGGGKQPAAAAGADVDMEGSGNTEEETGGAMAQGAVAARALCAVTHYLVTKSGFDAASGDALAKLAGLVAVRIGESRHLVDLVILVRCFSLGLLALFEV